MFVEKNITATRILALTRELYFQRFGPIVLRSFLFFLSYAAISILLQSIDFSSSSDQWWTMFVSVMAAVFLHSFFVAVAFEHSATLVRGETAAVLTAPRENRWKTVAVAKVILSMLVLFGGPLLAACFCGFAALMTRFEGQWVFGTVTCALLF